MTFDDKKEELLSKFTWVPIAEIEKAFFELKKEYEPTIEMTKEQYTELLITKQDKEPFIRVMSEFEYDTITASFDRDWYPLTEEQLMQAWLHPDTVKVVDELKQWSDND